MIQIHLSKALAEELDAHLDDPAPRQPRSMQWYAHIVTVQRRKCVLVMELQSRYCLLFIGLTRKDFLQFPEHFADRLWRDVLSLCQLNEAESRQLTELVHQVVAEQQYQLGTDRSVQSHLSDAADHLKCLATEIGRLPQSAAEEFGCSLHINETLRSHRDHPEFFRPVEMFRDFWLGLLEYTQQQDEQRGAAPGNVVPFRRH